MQPTSPIGVFDSGVGGLTVAAAISEYLPNEQIIYFGDTEHLPYGDKSEEAIQQYALKISDFLLQRNCKMIVIACNTASSVAYQLVQKYFGSEALIINVIDPVAEAVAANAQQKVGVMATRRTVQTGIYPQKISHLRPDLHIVAKAARSLATMIEEGLFHNKKIMAAIIEHYLADPDFADIDSLILGCTHYPIIAKDIHQYWQQNAIQPIQIFDSTDTVAVRVKQLLTTHQLLNSSKETPNYQCFISDYTQSFEQASQIFFKQKIKPQHFDLWGS